MTVLIYEMNPTATHVLNLNSTAIMDSVFHQRWLAMGMTTAVIAEMNWVVQVAGLTLCNSRQSLLVIANYLNLLRNPFLHYTFQSRSRYAHKVHTCALGWDANSALRCAYERVFLNVLMKFCDFFPTGVNRPFLW